MNEYVDKLVEMDNNFRKGVYKLGWEKYLEAQEFLEELEE